METYTQHPNDWNGLEIRDDKGLVVACFNSGTPEFIAGAMAAPGMLGVLEALKRRLPELDDPDAPLTGSDAVEVLADVWKDLNAAILAAAPRVWTVETEFYGDTWENVWTQDEAPMTFETLELAVDEIRDHVTDCINAVEGGEMDDSPDPSAFRVIETARGGVVGVYTFTGAPWTYEKTAEEK